MIRHMQLCDRHAAVDMRLLHRSGCRVVDRQELLA
jgi:hypothetical protein